MPWTCEARRDQLPRQQSAAAAHVEHACPCRHAGIPQQVHDRRMHAPDVVRVADVVDPREVGKVVRVLARRCAGRSSGRGCVGSGPLGRDGIAASHHALRKHHGRGDPPARAPVHCAAALTWDSDAVVPRILRIADPRAGVGDRPRRHAARLQHGQRRNAGAVLAATGVVEEHCGQRHLECECPRARSAVRAADDGRAGVVRCELGDRIDDDHAAAAAAHDFPLDHVRLR